MTDSNNVRGGERHHSLLSSVSNGAVDPDDRWAETTCACGGRWRANGEGSLAWVRMRFDEDLKDAAHSSHLSPAPPEDVGAAAELLRMLEMYRAGHEGWCSHGRSTRCKKDGTRTDNNGMVMKFIKCDTRCNICKQFDAWKESNGKH